MLWTFVVMFGPAALVFAVYGLSMILPSSREGHRHVDTYDVHPCEGCPEQ